MKMFYRRCIRNSASGLLQINHKQKKNNDVTICRHDVIVNIFDGFFLPSVSSAKCFARVSFAKFSYLSKSHVNILDGSRVMTIFLYKGLIRNPEIGNTPV